MLLLFTASVSHFTASNTRSSIPGLAMQLFFEIVSRQIYYLKWIYILTLTVLLWVVAQSSCYSVIDSKPIAGNNRSSIPGKVMLLVFCYGFTPYLARCLGYMDIYSNFHRLSFGRSVKLCAIHSRGFKSHCQQRHEFNSRFGHAVVFCYAFTPYLALVIWIYILTFTIHL